MRGSASLWIGGPVALLQFVGSQDILVRSTFYLTLWSNDEPYKLP